MSIISRFTILKYEWMSGSAENIVSTVEMQWKWDVRITFVSSVSRSFNMACGRMTGGGCA